MAGIREAAAAPLDALPLDDHLSRLRAQLAAALTRAEEAESREDAALVRAEQAEAGLLMEQEAHRATGKKLREVQFGEAEVRREMRAEERAKAQREISEAQQAFDEEARLASLERDELRHAAKLCQDRATAAEAREQHKHESLQEKTAALAEVNML